MDHRSSERPSTASSHRSRRSRRRLALAVPVVLSLTASLGFLPAAASAAPPADSARQAARATGTAEAPSLAYVVNTRTDHRTIASVQRAIAEADGSVVATYRQIGVIVVHSANPDFGAEIRKARGVQSAGATRTAPLTAAGTTDQGAAEVLTAEQAARTAKASKAAGAGEPLEADQWDLRAIGADKAAKINPGSSRVTVAVIDTGVDDTHPDLAPNFSAAQSANCVGGKADTSEGAWRPYTADDYHGTHVAGEIAAARNGIGVAGVAPGVKVSSIKVSDPDNGLFYPENVVCAFVFAADHGVEITNNSYYVDPWLYNCMDDPDQRAIVDAVNRAQLYAQRKGTLHLASAGNSNHDLDSDAIVDDSSPDDSTPVTRTIDPHECFDVPTQLPGIVTVSATGVDEEKSYYSSYGKGVVDVAAPGGDARYQIPDTPSKNGRILSTMPNNAYAWLQGTSMASPHAAGVAALLKSEHPWASPATLQRLLKAQADNPGCPASYDQDGDGTQDAGCEGGKRVNGFYGHGIVDALRAVK
ncbi:MULTISPECIES: S8 family serine peptidase [Streptomyces]|uniref:S8 family serine peptidase n=3 Tax=Streptomyces rochei group TaxID=2867164 RepID=A0ABW7E8T9_STRRO|nr:MULTISPECIES: S8 family serine peptidase [Streptomyces]MBQ0915861.1 S8 family serine peptidase [Streptomyces sp. RM99]MBU8548963.1 S8 family serine peptidase [Streptomyces sp. Osf17]MBU8555739.1 S8 family serine peptidase [Streptomyces sp. Babs14]QCR46858.1 peptidase S8 [Streptomyces sp. SGAir0924]RSS70808.1 peptidase S8 [Streptomyces sp. WAC06273]